MVVNTERRRMAERIRKSLISNINSTRFTNSQKKISSSSAGEGSRKFLPTH
jgi:hypothetical protein